MKNEIRKQNKSLRASMPAEEVRTKSKAASKAFLDSDIYKNSKVIMLYMPLGNETDTSDIIKSAFADGKTVVFPVTDRDSCEITPCVATKDTVFVSGAFSVSEPSERIFADINSIDVILTPGIAFDESGSRVGFGKGCYDRLLRDSSAVKVGFCYDFQICEKIATDCFDVSMDYIASETGLTECLKKQLKKERYNYE